MKKQYFYSIYLLASVFFLSVSAQEARPTAKDPLSIDGLSLYPNPVTNSKVYIITKNDEEKEVEIYDVLGKKVFQTTLNSRELNLSSLKPGVYIIKIKEREITATRKLIVY